MVSTLVRLCLNICIMYNCFVLVLLGLCASCYGQAAVDKLLRNYDPRESPADAGYGPTDVRIGVYVNSVYYDTNEKQLLMRLYFRESWEDERLRFVAQNGKEKLRVDPRDHSKVWYPDTFFRQAVKVEGYEASTVEALTRINATGNVWRVRSLLVGVPCKEGPVNTTCSLMTESFSYTVDTMTLAWLNSPIYVDSEYASIGPTKMKMVDTNQHDCSRAYSAGTFPCLEMEFVFKKADESDD